MSEMIERIIAANKIAWDEWPVPIDASNVDQVRHAAAKAVISALREPTEAMEQAYYAACDVNGMCLWKHGYRVMIDAATAPSLPSHDCLPEAK